MSINGKFLENVIPTKPHWAIITKRDVLVTDRGQEAMMVIVKYQAYSDQDVWAKDVRTAEERRDTYVAIKAITAEITWDIKIAVAG